MNTADQIFRSDRDPKVNRAYARFLAGMSIVLGMVCGAVITIIATLASGIFRPVEKWESWITFALCSIIVAVGTYIAFYRAAVKAGHVAPRTEPSKRR